MLIFWFALGLLVLCLVDELPWFEKWAARAAEWLERLP